MNNWPFLHFTGLWLTCSGNQTPQEQHISCIRSVTYIISRWRFNVLKTITVFWQLGAMKDDTWSKNMGTINLRAHLSIFFTCSFHR